MFGYVFIGKSYGRKKSVLIGSILSSFRCCSFEFVSENDNAKFTYKKMLITSTSSLLVAGSHRPKRLSSKTFTIASQSTQIKLRHSKVPKQISEKKYRPMFEYDLLH